jgi:hypothetical protein
VPPSLNFPQLDFVEPSSGFHPVTWERVTSSGLGPIEEKKFTIVGGITNTPINNNVLGSHKHNSVGISCPRLPHEGPSSPITSITHTIIVNMVTFLIDQQLWMKMNMTFFWSIPKEPLRA